MSKDQPEQNLSPQQEINNLLNRTEQDWTPDEKYQIAKLYEENDPSQNLSKKEALQLAYSWYKEAAENEDYNAQAKMMDFPQDNWEILGITKKQGIRESYKWLLLLAKDEYALAQNDLGYLYMNSYKELQFKGLTELKAMRLAHKWFKEAEKDDCRDDNAAEYNLAKLYASYPQINFLPKLDVFLWFTETIKNTECKNERKEISDYLKNYLHGQREDVLDKIKEFLKSEQHEAFSHKNREEAVNYTSILLLLQECLKDKPEQKLLPESKQPFLYKYFLKRMEQEKSLNWID